MTAFLSTLLLMVLLALPGIVAVRVSGHFFGEAEWWRRAFAAACLYPLFIWGVLMLLAPFGLMQLWPVLLAMVVLAGLSLAIPPVKWNWGSIDKDYLEPRWQLALGTGFAVAGMGVFLLGNYITGTAYMSDDYAYHGPTIAAWFRTGTLDHPRIIFVHYYPFNSHLLTLYTILPSGDLRWTWVATFVWLLLGCAGLLALTRCVPRYTLAWGLMTATAFLICREVSWHHFFTLAPSDVSGAVVFLCAFVVAFPRKDAPPREALARITLAAMLVGFAMGTKATFALPSVVAGFGLLIIAMLGHSPFRFLPRLGTTVGLSLLGAIATGSYWYLWNWIHARNPVFPARVWNFRGPGHDRWWGDTKLISHIENAPDSGIYREIWDQAINWPPLLGIISLIGIFAFMGFIVWLLWSAISQRTLQPLGHPLLWLFAAGSVLLIQYPFMPYTGSFPVTGPDLWINQRYFIVFFMVGIIAVCWGLSSLTYFIRDPLISRIVGAVAFLAFAYALWLNFPFEGRGDGNTQSLPARLLGLLVGLLIMAWPHLSFPRQLVADKSARRILLAAVLVAILALGTIRERILPPPYMSVIPIPWTRVVPSLIHAIDQLPDGSRIGEFSMNVWETWYLTGSRLQHEPVILWEQGPEMMQLHEAFYGGMIDKDYPRLGLNRQDYLPNPDTFVEKFREVDLDYVFITRYITGINPEKWPPQRPFVQEMPEYELYWSDAYSEIYRRIPDSELGVNESP